MGRATTIPVRVVRRERELAAAGEERVGRQANGETVRAERRTSSAAPSVPGSAQPAESWAGSRAGEGPPAEVRRSPGDAATTGETAAAALSRGAAVEGREAAEVWRERALRLQAEMENYRKRQRRLAENQIETERQRILLSFLRVVDDLERALAAPQGSEEGLRQGVRLTRKAALQLLGGEGAERIEAEGQPFDPHWHEAVATVDSRDFGAAPHTVVQVTDAGYRLEGQVLRPARVVVAV